MSRPRHTFLFEPARWEAAGTFSDAAGRMVPVEGFSLVLHCDGLWYLEGRMRLEGEQTVEIVNSYTIAPFPPGAAVTTWTSHNPELGTLSGRFAVVEDTILSFFQGESGAWSGSEWLHRINASTYQVRGILMAQNRLVSAWAVDLRRCD